MTLLDILSSFANQWLGSSLTELVLFFLGTLLCIIIIGAAWDNRLHLLTAICGFGSGLFLVLIALGNKVPAGWLWTALFLLFAVIFLFGIYLIIVRRSIRSGSGIAGVFRDKTMESNGPPPGVLPRAKLPSGKVVSISFIILLAVSAVFTVGMLAPQAMIGDEVTHYYMLKTQADDLSVPNFYAKIPTGWGEVEVRRYPHSFLWHYVGALVYRLTGGSFLFTQLYQSLFFCQLLVAASLLAAGRKTGDTLSPVIYLLIVASLPMSLIFSVAFYQDIPMTAQILTAFYLLKKQRWILATFFLCLAMAIKVTAVLFIPAFFICLLFWTTNRFYIKRSLIITFSLLIMVSGFIYGYNKVFLRYSGSQFYPVAQIEQIVNKSVKALFPPDNLDQNQQVNSTAAIDQTKVVSEQASEIIANHPGNLLIKVNYLVYGGLILWLAIGGAVVSAFLYYGARRARRSPRESSVWLLGTGLSYIVLTGWMLRTAPDARFFFPGLILCLLPVAEWVARLPKSRWIVMLLTALAVIQSGYTLAKVHHLRQISPKVEEAIVFLRDNPPAATRIFMYPEGNYRLFPVRHTWYLKYHLRDLWRADNDERIRMFHQYGIGAVVVKKHLIVPLDSEMNNLGVYPPAFVSDLQNDGRFKKTFENEGIVIYTVPAVEP